MHIIPCGFPNISNSCYMNSALQCLLSINPLYTYIKNKQFKKYVSNKRTSVNYALYKVLKNKHKYTKIIFYLQHLKFIIGENNKIFSNNNQQDSQEFLNVLLCDIMNELKYKPIIKNIFNNIQTTIVKCDECNTTVEKYDDFNILSLAIPENVHSTTLNECINMYLCLTKLDGNNMYECEVCNKKTSATLKYDIHKISNVLIIHLKRFNQNLSKNNTLCTFPINNFVVCDKQFELTGVIYHRGSLFGGHYTASCKGMFNNNWYNYDDNVACQIDTNNIVNSQAYVLVYQCL